MIHRHLTTNEWTLMAIESLMDRGDLADWREFARAMRADAEIAARVVEVCRYREADGTERIALALVRHYHPSIATPPDHSPAASDEIIAPPTFARE